MKFLNTNICNPSFMICKMIDKFLLFEIKNVNKLIDIITFEIDLKDQNNKNFLIEGEDKMKNKYKIDKNEESNKNKKFELKLDLKNEKIEIQEITGYDALNKKNIYSDNIFIFDFKDFTCVIFKLTKKVKKIIKENIDGVLKNVEKEVDEDKYIFCNDCNTFEIGTQNSKDYYGMFSIIYPENNFYKIYVEWVSKNKDKWTNIKNIFSENKFIEEVDFGNFDYKFNDISFCFSRCKNLKIVKNLKKLFNDNLNSATCFFDECTKIDNVDISDIKLPADSSDFFGNSSIKNLKYDNLDCIKCKNLECFFAGSNIEEFDFNKLKNVENIEIFSMFFCECKNLKKVIFNNIDFKGPKEVNQMFSRCENLNEIIGFENVKLNIQNGKYLFRRCKILKKLNLSNIIINNIECIPIVDFRYIKDLILPNDPNSAKIIIENVQEFFEYKKKVNKNGNNNENNNEYNNEFNLIYKGTKLENVSEFDELIKFINDPENYIKKENRENVLKVNEQNYKKSLQNLDNLNKNTLKQLGCCSNCCSNFCCCCKGG